MRNFLTDENTVTCSYDPIHGIRLVISFPETRCSRQLSVDDTIKLVLLRSSFKYSAKEHSVSATESFFCLTSTFAEGCVQLSDGEGFSSVRQWPFFFNGIS